MALYKSMHEIELEQKAAAESRGEAYMPNEKMYIDRVREDQHPGCYNDCQKGDIAAVFVSKDERPPDDFKVCVHARNTGEPHIFDMAARNENTDAMCIHFCFRMATKVILTFPFSKAFPFFAFSHVLILKLLLYFCL